MNPFFQQLFQQARNLGVRAFNQYQTQWMRNMGPSLRRGTGMTAGPLGSINTATRRDPGIVRSAAGGALSAPGMKPYAGAITAAVATDVANKSGLTGAIETGLDQVSPALDKFFGAITPEPIQQFGRQIETNLDQVGPALENFFGAITPEPIQEFGRQQEKKGWGGVLEVATPYGFLVSGLMRDENPNKTSPSKPTRPLGTKATLKGQPVFWTGDKYGWQTGPSALKAGLLGPEVVGINNSARTQPPVDSGPASSIPGESPDMSQVPPQGTPSAPVLPPPALTGGLSPAARAEQQERARIAQLTEQDPLTKKYKVADLTKAYNTAATPEEKEKIGLQIWATTNPQLATRLKPGQTGYEQAASVFGTQTFGTNQPGITQAELSQFAERVGAPAMSQPPGGFNIDYTTPVPNFSVGLNAQQLGYSPEGEVPPAMIGAEAFNQQKPFTVPKELLDQKALSLLRQAFAKGLK